MAVIKAPAGFGKTSLAASWANRLHRNGVPVAWLSIDAADDEPPRFLFNMMQAIRRVTPAVGAEALDLIGEQVLISPHAIVSSLINDLTDIDEEIYLFLEDYHWLTNSAIHEAVAFLLKRAPSQMHIVLTTRTEPQLPLASLRANNQLLEIDTSILRFDEQETREFLETEQHDSFELADVKLLHSRTEGWPAALRIIVSTLGHDFGRLVRNLSVVQRPIDAYMTEMLDGLPGDLVLFMLRTSILERLSAPLCSSVTGMAASQSLLVSIEQRQLLLSALDQERQWYRYHPLLAEYLKRRLVSEFGPGVAELHCRAAQWYATQEFWTEAIQHAIAAGDTDKALGWIENSAMGLVRKGDLFTLLAWQRLFPPDLMRTQPAVKLAIAWGLALATRVDEALRMLNEIEHDLAGAHTSGDLITTECHVIRAVALSLKDEGRVALPLAEQAMSQSEDPWTANVASNVVRYWRCRVGDFKAFYETPWIPYSSDDDRRNVFASVYRRCIQGFAEAQQLRLAAAERYYAEASRLAEQHVGSNSIAAALPASLLSQIRYEQGRVEEAEALLIDRIPAINAGAMPECVLSACVTIVRIAAFRMNFDRAFTLLERAESLGVTRDWGRLCAAVALERVSLYLKEGRIGEGAVALERLEQLARTYPSAIDFAWSDIEQYTILARANVASARQQFDEAISTLKSLKAEALRVQNHYFALRAGVQLSVALFRAGQVTEAFAELRRVLNPAAQAGIRQTILDAGYQIVELLIAFRESVERSGKLAELVPYSRGLIEAWGNQPGSTLNTGSRPVDPLSAREGTILELIARGLSNKEIARDLTIAPETVKSHVKHIFTKLGAEKRAQAVARAQSLGLVTTH